MNPYRRNGWSVAQKKNHYGLKGGSSWNASPSPGLSLRGWWPPLTVQLSSVWEVNTKTS